MYTNIIPAEQVSRSFSALRLLLFEDTPSQSLVEQFSPSPVSPTITPLHRHLTALCLHNPYWNDFRILNHFQKLGLTLTQQNLAQLKKECNLDNREIICNTLLRLATDSGLKLNSRQISYIERAKPEFRDRDLQSSAPGELIVYQRLFGRGVGDFGRVYLHVFADMYTGRIFGELNKDRSVTAGLHALKNTIFPTYKYSSYQLNTILHSAQDAIDLKQFNELETVSAFSELGLQWFPTNRTFGMVEKFERYLIQQNNFFGNVPVLFSNLEQAFAHQLARYNATNRWFSRRTLLDY
ncbi:MAG: hypothetical protein H6Q74_1816 [Firmicutes bacterium]|nr:hypothetical protein [Bacillota bacterium]